MMIEEVQACDESGLEAMMLHTIRTSVRMDEAEMAGVVANVLANMRWAFDHAQQCVHLKCVDEGRILGVVLVKNFWNLCSLFVEPHHHRRGVGRSLIEAAVKRCAPRNERQYLQVNAAPNAIEFYRSMGFAKLEDARVFGTSTPMALPLGAQ
ncbi:MAG: GNAT family N-acetyltransferase [Paraburkholderia sp.]|jgi:GNAT superfamily N-acetyltransferase|uniref:GNAT family N-acetyltransferase n=1 Tax=Burkholderiaceae TaxID=119060 RepID=UPI0010F454FA|nr:GNAT family N-acetyltransferase [Burkholderia sp. 4M9327F10]